MSFAIIVNRDHSRAFIIFCHFFTQHFTSHYDSFSTISLLSFLLSLPLSASHFFSFLCPFRSRRLWEIKWECHASWLTSRKKGRCGCRLSRRLMDWRCVRSADDQYMRVLTIIAIVIVTVIVELLVMLLYCAVIEDCLACISYECMCVWVYEVVKAGGSVGSMKWEAQLILVGCTDGHSLTHS